MSFYATIDNICQKLAGYLDSITDTEERNALAILKEYQGLFSESKDLYSNSLLRQGVKKEHLYLFANVPYSRYRWIIGEIEEVFVALGLPTTQARAYKLSSELNRKGVTNALTAEQLNGLRNMEAVKNHFEKVVKWCNDAREVIAVVRANQQLIETVTEEEREFGKSLNFDWHYSYSDDIEVYRRGCDTHDRVSAETRKVLAEKPHLRKVVETVAAGAGLGVSFFTE